MSLDQRIFQEKISFISLLSQSLFIVVSLGCQFQDYEDSLLPKSMQLSVDSKCLQIQLEQPNVRGFGFWSQSIPLLNNIKTQSIFEAFDLTKNQDGQLLFIIENTQLQNIFSVGYQKFDYDAREVIHIIEQYNNNQLKKSVQYRFPAFLYEGFWIFHLITFEIAEGNGENFYVELSQNEKQYIGLFPYSEYKIYLGGSSYVMNLNLNFFKGRLSKIIQIQNDQSFNQLADECSIPPKYQEEQTTIIVDGMKVFNGEISLLNYFEQSGSNYYISGWVKYKSINYKKDHYTLIRLSGFQNYKNRQKLGDDLFVFETQKQLLLLMPIIQLSYLCNYMPFVQSFQEQYDSTFQGNANNQYQIYQTENIIQDSENELIYDGLTKWHFLSYEYLGTQETDKMHLILYFFNELDRTELFLGNGMFQGSFTNSFFYCIFGGDNYNNNYFHGEISDFTISYQYQDSKIQDDVLICEKTCLTCDGPAKTNCLSCFDDQNRFYLEEQKICVCIEGYFESENDNCLAYLEDFPSLNFENIVFDDPTNCKIGEFRLPNSNNSFDCKPCPKNIDENGLSCIDCVLQSKTWYLKPVCKRYLIRISTNENTPYFIKQRKAMDYDVYTIGRDQELHLRLDFQHFCDDTVNCLQTPFIHLGQEAVLLCKEDSYAGEKIDTCLKIFDLHCTYTQFPNQDTCESCFSGYYTLGYHCLSCPTPCLECIYNIEESNLECSSCINPYASQNKQCKQCGQNCAICKLEFSESSQEGYLRCLKCVDDSKYYLGLEGVDCKIKLIRDCLYSFETINYDYSINTIDHNFQIQQNQLDFIELCAFCKLGYMFIFEQQLCVEIINSQCDFGIGYFDTITNQYQLNDCLITSDEQSFISNIQFSKNCNLYNPNCITCLQTDLLHEYFCLECKFGYYASKISGKCIECPQNLFCDKCIQQEKEFETHWKINTRAFYRKYIENIKDHFFTKYAQSQNENDYFVQCIQCKEGYRLYNNICIQYCFSDCAECILYDGQYYCTKCHSIQQIYNPLFLENNKCIECSENCKLCIPRTQEEINSINPLFNSETFRKYSHHCLIPMKSEKTVYDQDFGIFLDCNIDDNENCSQEIILELFLFGSEEEYQDELYLDELFSYDLSFPKFQNQKFYQIANSLQITKISLKIMSHSKGSLIDSNIYIVKQIFSENIFSLHSVELDLYFNKENQVSDYAGSQPFYFINFKKIRIENLKFDTWFPLSLDFQSPYEQEVVIKYLTSNCPLSITISNSQYFELSDVTFYRFAFYYGSMFQIKSDLQSFQANLKNIYFSNLEIWQSSIFDFNSKSEASITLENINIVESLLINSSLIQLKDQINLIQINKIKFNNTFFNYSENFLDLSKFQIAELNNLILVDSYFTDSSFINIQNNAILQNIEIQSSILSGNSTLIYNSNLSPSIFNTTIKSLSFSNISYYNLVKFINFKTIETKISILNIDQITLQNNYLSNISLMYDQYQENSSLISIEIKNVNIQNYKIERGPGLVDFYFKDLQNLYLYNGFITQTKYQFKGLHQDINCQLKYSQGKYYPSSLFIFSLKTLKVENLEISNVQIYDFAILAYYSNLLNEQNYLQTFMFSNLSVKGNVLLQTKSVPILGLFSFLCYHETKISFQNSVFSQNIFHMYEQSLDQNSAGIITIDGQYNFINVETCIFEQNMAINGSSSILLLTGLELNISNSFFFQNSIFNYELLQPNLIWGFEDLENVYIETIQNVFSIKSDAGNGIIKVNTIYMDNNVFNQTQGLKGACFKITTQLPTFIQISNCNFYKISTLFQNQNENGGIFYIDSQSTYQLELQIKNITADQIYCKSFGGFLYVASLSSNIIIELYNISLSDIYSEIGSIIFSSFQPDSSMNTQLLVSLVFLQNSILGYYNFLSHYKLNHDFDLLKNLMNNRTLIFVENCIFINIQNSVFVDLAYESFLNCQNSTNIVLNRIKIFNSTSVNKLIQFYPSENKNSNIQFNSMQFENITLGFSIDNQTCISPVSIQGLAKFICLLEEVEAPKNLESNSVASDNDFALCSLQQMFQQLDISEAGMIQLIGLNQNTEIRLNEFILNTINCEICMNGLIFISYGTQTQLELLWKLQNLKITNSQCGQFGCLTINKIPTTLNNQQSSSMYNISKFFQIIIKNYICTQNIGTFGTCLYLQKTQTWIQDSYFSENIAQNGGAIFIEGKEKIVFENAVIEKNVAEVGGGIFFQDQSSLEFQKLDNIVWQNSASFFGKNIASIPSALTLIIQGKQLKTTLYKHSDLEIVELINLQNKLTSSDQIIKVLKIPTGQAIGQYQFFNSKNRIYIKSNLTIRLVALGKDLDVMKNLEDTNCTIKSRQIVDDNQESQFTNNYTSISQIFYDTQTNSYNLDDLIVYFDNNVSSSNYLQLEFSCLCVQIPIYSAQYPYQIVQTHQNYKLRANFRTYECQYGEIKNFTNFACQKCDSSLGMYSLILNQQKCNLINQVDTISVMDNQLNLRPTYWRPYFDTDDISFCLNLPANCLGGWIEGDNSCYFGHIGALCEQCDLYDIRGNGRFSNQDRFSCSPCRDQSRNAIFIAATVIFTFIFLFISVQGNLKSLEDNFKIQPLFRIALSSLAVKTQSSILMKMLTNYLQIVASITTFQLQLQAGVTSTLNAVGNPIQSAAYSLDCFLTDMFPYDIQYGRIIWQLIVPFIYTFVFLLVFQLAAKLKLILFNFSVVTTTLIYIFIYFQPNLIGGFVQILSYRKISGFKWIQANLAERYDTLEHYKWIIKFCLPLFLVLAILLPICLFLGLFKNRFKLEEKKSRINWGYLYNEYKIEAYFWELIKIFQKTLNILALNYYQDSVAIKGILVLFITYIYQELNGTYLPYQLYSLNKLDYYSANVCMITFCLAVGAYLSQAANITELEIPFFVLITLFNFLFLQLILGKIIEEYLRSFEENLDKIRDFIRKKFPSLNNEYFSKYLKNKGQQRQKVQERFQRIKRILIPIIKSTTQTRKNLLESAKPCAKTLTTSIERTSVNFLTGSQKYLLTEQITSQAKD